MRHARFTLKRVFDQLGNHEMLARAVWLDIFRAKSMWNCRAKTETGIVGRMADEENQFMPQRCAAFQSFPHQRRTDAAILMIGMGGDRPQSSNRECFLAISNDHGRKGDMPHNFAIQFGDERENQRIFVTQPVNQISLVRPTKRRQINRMNRRHIIRGFQANLQWMLPAPIMLRVDNIFDNR